jgi:hypothetical protein
VVNSSLSLIAASCLLTQLASVALASVCDRLSEVHVIPFKGEKVEDAAYNAIIKAGETPIPCLVENLVNTAPMQDPRKAPPSKTFVVADLAGMLLCQITGRPFDDQLPPEVRESFPERGVAAYFDYVKDAENRASLQADWQKFLLSPQRRHWSEIGLPESAIAAIHHDESAGVVEFMRAQPKSKLNQALIAACRLGKLEPAKALIALGAEPSFLIERHPAIGEESPLHYAIESDNLSLVAYLLTYKGALHVLARGGDALELGTAAGKGRVEATSMLLDALRRKYPHRSQHHLQNAILVMIWNKQRAAAIDLISRNLQNLPDSSLENLRKSVVKIGGASSLSLLEEVWRTARESNSR